MFKVDSKRDRFDATVLSFNVDLTERSCQEAEEVADEGAEAGGVGALAPAISRQWAFHSQTYRTCREKQRSSIQSVPRPVKLMDY